MMHPRALPYRLATAALLALSALGLHAPAQTVFDFETPDQLANSALVSGDVANFPTTNEQGLASDNSIRFNYATEDPYQSWTYDMPFAIDTGTVSVWFYDTRGADATFDTYGGSIILEEVNNPANFLAVEVWNGPYPFGGDPSPGAPNYYITRGSATGPTTFNSRYFGDRSVGFHEVVFNIQPSGSTVTVNGIENAGGTGIITGPASTTPLRLRFMAWSASDGGFSNWVTSTTPSTLSVGPGYIYIDDLTVIATTPTANSRTESFEIVTGTATYDTAGEFMGSPANDNPFMAGLVPQWTPTTNATFVRTGTQALGFTGGQPLFKSLLFDLTDAEPGSITLSFYDAFGPDSSFDDVGGAIMIEQTANPGNFLAAEIWNAPYPAAGDPTPGAPNYYITRGTAGNPVTNFSSRYFGNRQVGWNTVEIVLTATESRIVINGVENSNGAGVITGPGLNDGIRLRLMADSPSCGGFTNYTLANELQYLYLNKTTPYVYFDQLSLPVSSVLSVAHWLNYE